MVTYLPPFGNINFCSATAQFAPFCLTGIKEHNEKVKIAIQLHYVIAFLKVAKVLLGKKLCINSLKDFEQLQII